MAMARPQSPDYDKRREAILAAAAHLYAERGFQGASVADLAKACRTSKSLIYHYFPSKQAYFVATLEDAARDLADQINPDPEQPPRDQLDAALRVWLAWVEENQESYEKLMRGVTSVPELRSLIDGVREATVSLIADRLLHGENPDPKVRSTVGGWLAFMDGVCIDWVRHRDQDRAAVHRVLAAALPATLAAAGLPELAELFR